MKKALIKDTRICEVTAAEFPVHPSLQWVDVPDDTTDRDTYVNGTVVKYVPAVELAIDQGDLDQIHKQLKALALVMAQWNGKTVPQLKAAFRAAMESLP